MKYLGVFLARRGKIVLRDQQVDGILTFRDGGVVWKLPG